MQLRVEDVGDQGQQEKQGGDKQSCRVEDVGELLALLLLLPSVTHTEGDLQVNCWLSSGVELKMNDWREEEGDYRVGGEEYLEVDQTEVCLVVDVGHRDLLLVVRVASLQVSLL